MRLFKAIRKAPPANYLADGLTTPDGVDFEGVVFDDGTVAVRWLTQYHSMSFWQDFDTLLAVHGHQDYDTVIEWVDTSAISPS